MSSILDALKKLEEEKARDPSAIADLPLDEASAAAELTGRRPVRPVFGRGLGAGVAVPAVLSVSLFLALISVGMFYMNVRVRQLDNVETGFNRTFAQQVPAPHVSQPVPVESSAEQIPSGVDTHSQGISAERGPISDAVSTRPSSAQEPLPEELVSKLSVSWEPLEHESQKSVVYVKADPQSPKKTEMSSLPPPAVPPVPKANESISDPSVLPILTPSEQSRLGLPRLRVNFVSRASSSGPQPYALINYNKVYVGETIPETNARLVGVSVKGVGIDVGGQKYFVPAR